VFCLQKDKRIRNTIDLEHTDDEVDEDEDEFLDRVVGADVPAGEDEEGGGDEVVDGGGEQVGQGDEEESGDVGHGEESGNGSDADSVYDGFIDFGREGTGDVTGDADAVCREYVRR
jgi:hypothetical protein